MELTFPFFWGKLRRQYSHGPWRCPSHEWQSRKWNSIWVPIQAKFWFPGLPRAAIPQSNYEIDTGNPLHLGPQSKSVMMHVSRWLGDPWIKRSLGNRNSSLSSARKQHSVSQIRTSIHIFIPYGSVTQYGVDTVLGTHQFGAGNELYFPSSSFLLVPGNPSPSPTGVTPT